MNIIIQKTTSYSSFWTWVYNRKSADQAGPDIFYATEINGIQFAVPASHEEHGTRQHRCAVGDDVRAGVSDGQRGAVVGVHAHAAGGEDQLTARLFRFQNGGGDARRVVVADLVEGIWKER